MSHTALLCLRNEGAFVLEWLAHHRACGFDDFVVFSNDCQDGTDAMLDRLQQMGWLTHRRNDGPYAVGGIQFTALNLAAEMPQVREAEWLMALDVDEFVNIHTGGHRLADLHAALPEADAITLTWRLFGNAGRIRYEDRPVTESFTRCAPVRMPWPWRAAMFKTLHRTGIWRKPGVHRPRAPDPEREARARWFDGAGRALSGPVTTKRLYSDYPQDNYTLVQLNHYPLGAMESYVLKADRGRAVHAADVLGLDYWVERNWNTDEDTSIAALAPERAALLAELMADATLARLHAEAVRWRHRRFAELLGEDTYRALFGRLLMTPPSRPLTPEAAGFLTRQATRARQAPD